MDVCLAAAYMWQGVGLFREDFGRLGEIRKALDPRAGSASTTHRLAVCCRATDGKIDRPRTKPNRSSVGTWRLAFCTTLETIRKKSHARKQEQKEAMVRGLDDGGGGGDVFKPRYGSSLFGTNE